MPNLLSSPHLVLVPPTPSPPSGDGLPMYPKCKIAITVPGQVKKTHPSLKSSQFTRNRTLEMETFPPAFSTAASADRLVFSLSAFFPRRHNGNKWRLYLPCYFTGVFFFFFDVGGSPVKSHVLTGRRADHIKGQRCSLWWQGLTLNSVSGPRRRLQ